MNEINANNQDPKDETAVTFEVHLNGYYYGTVVGWGNFETLMRTALRHQESLNEN